MNNRIASIARHTALEALRTRLPLTTAIVAGALLAASFFVREIAVTESIRFQAAFYAATVRFAMVFLAALYVIASLAREFQDKGLEIVLALDLPRAHYLLGRLGGFLVIALALSAVAGVPLFFLGDAMGAAQWSASLAMELAVVIALSVFCVVTFNQLMPAASFVIAFYLFARAITAVRLIGEHPIAGAEALSHRVMASLVEALALVMPALDQWTRTEWLVEAPASWLALAAIGAHAALFVAIFGAGAVFDLYRRNF